MASYELRQTTYDAAELSAVAALLRSIHPQATHLTEAYLLWLYRDNPDGQAIGTDAWFEGALVGHNVGVPIVAWIEGRKRRGLLSVNTATHRAHQGHGIFEKLAESTHGTGFDRGYDFIVGVTNAQGTPVFLHKIGGHVVGPLQALIGFGPINLRNEDGVGERDEGGGYAFRRLWTNESLAWRLANPHAKYRVRRGDVRAEILADSGYPGIAVNLGQTTLPVDIPTGLRTPLRLWIGTEAMARRRRSAYFNLPARLRPSPLNLMFKDLRYPSNFLDQSDVHFSGLDFDAY